VGRNDVSGTSTANGVDWGVVLVEQSITLKLFVKGKHCSLGLGLDVSGTTAASKENLGVRGSGRCSSGDSSCWGSGAKEAAGKTAVVACTAAAGVVVSTAVVDWRTLGDLDGHFAGLESCDVW
jgi:hypothetical protein